MQGRVLKLSNSYLSKEPNNVDLKQENFCLFRLPDLVFLGQCHRDIKKNKVYFTYSIFGITMTEKLFLWEEAGKQ